MSARKTSAVWESVAEAVSAQVPRGRVTTYAEVSRWAKGHSGAARAVGTMLKAWAAHDKDSVTHRVIKADGTTVPARPGQPSQATLLKREGVPFSANGRVDLGKCRPVQLKGGKSRGRSR